MMSPADTRALLQQLRTSPHRYLAIRPSDATPAEAPGILLQDRTANDLSYACTTAGQVWPQCEQWDLIGSDELLNLKGKDWVPTMRALRMPEKLASFNTTGPAPA
jgi:hypothetical protein